MFNLKKNCWSFSLLLVSVCVCVVKIGVSVASSFRNVSEDSTRGKLGL